MLSCHLHIESWGNEDVLPWCFSVLAALADQKNYGCDSSYKEKRALLASNCYTGKCHDMPGVNEGHAHWMMFLKMEEVRGQKSVLGSSWKIFFHYNEVLKNIPEEKISFLLAKFIFAPWMFRMKTFQNFSSWESA